MRASESPPSPYEAIISLRGHLNNDDCDFRARGTQANYRNRTSVSGTLANARYVYVAAYDGDQFNPNLLPEDREAIGAVQSAIQTWGKLTLVYQPSQADIIILVTSRPSEDLMAVYDADGSRGNYLWRVMGRDGLASGETPLVTQFEKGFESVQKHK